MLFALGIPGFLAFTGPEYRKTLDMHIRTPAYENKRVDLISTCVLGQPSFLGVRIRSTVVGQFGLTYYAFGLTYYASCIRQFG